MRIVPHTGVTDRTGTLLLWAREIQAIIGFAPNNNEEEPDTKKVRASWCFMDADTGRVAYVWSCHQRWPLRTCQVWSTGGDSSLLAEVFGDKMVQPNPALAPR